MRVYYYRLILGGLVLIDLFLQSAVAREDVAVVGGEDAAVPRDAVGLADAAADVGEDSHQEFGVALAVYVGVGLAVDAVVEGSVEG